MSPKEECERLMNVLLSFAENQLKKYGEFYPFGAVMLNNDELSLTAYQDVDNEFPASAEVIDALTKMHREEAAQGEIKASGICWDAKVTLANGRKTDAVIISLEHRDDYSVRIVQAYRLGPLKKLHLSRLFVQKGSCEVFVVEDPPSKENT